MHLNHEHMKQTPTTLSGVQQAWLNLGKDNLVSIRDCARQLGVSAHSIRRWLRSGRLKGVKVAGRYRIRQSTILNFIQEIHADGPPMPVLPK
jgi:excisionase family DNA binding protein